MEQKTKKNDILLIGVILVLALAAYVGVSIFQDATTHNAEALVLIDGEEYGRFPLDTDVVERIELPDGSYNVLVIEEGKADVTEASCPDGICVNHRAVSRQKQSITCLPNKLVVEIRNGEESDVDAITN
ncbi:MAG: NusG domain II-containing protein [Roseburia sp.]|nr:NusG domain II-containing protein [Roseburia sp.]